MREEPRPLLMTGVLAESGASGLGARYLLSAVNRLSSRMGAWLADIIKLDNPVAYKLHPECVNDFGTLGVMRLASKRV